MLPWASEGGQEGDKTSGVASPKLFGAAKCLTLDEQQYFCLGRRF